MPDQLLDRAFLASLQQLERLTGPDWGPDEFVARRGKRQYWLRRVGTCRPQECDSACCAMFCLRDEMSDYLAGFADQGLRGPIIPLRCRFLQADGDCRRHGAPDYPQTCQDFPTPTDPMYLEVMERCGFGFTLVEALVEAS